MTEKTKIKIICSKEGIDTLELDGDSSAMMMALFYVINKIFKDNGVPEKDIIKAANDMMKITLNIFDETND